MSPEQPVFYYDLGSPRCYLAAERILGELPVVAEWEPVLGAAVGVIEPKPDRPAIETIAGARGLQPLRWPPGPAGDLRIPMLAATYAKQIGRTVAFSLAAFRQQFAGGRDLTDPDTVLIAAAACEVHPTAMLRGIGLRSVAEGLERACARARDAGVRSLPAVQVIMGGLFEGDEAIEAAARAIEEQRESEPRV